MSFSNIEINKTIFKTIKNIDLLLHNTITDIPYSESAIDSSISIKLDINLIVGKQLVINFNDKSLTKNTDTSQTENLKSLFAKPHNIIGLSNGFIQMKYPGSDIYEPINWLRLKYIYKDNASDTNIINLIKGIGSLRRFVVSQLRDFIIENFTQGCYNESGSANATSDLDFTYINLLNPVLSVISMDVFYKIFSSIFGGSSADVFDTNYYICSTFIKDTCYSKSSDEKISIGTINYGIDYRKMSRINNLFNMCISYIDEYYDLNISAIESAAGSNPSLTDPSLTDPTLTDPTLANITNLSKRIPYIKKNVVCKKTIPCTIDQKAIPNKLDKIFYRKMVSDNLIYVLDFPIELPVDITPANMLDYNNYKTMDLFMSYALLYDCIQKEILHLNLGADTDLMTSLISISDNKLVSDNTGIKYDLNLKYSYIYYNCLDVIKNNADGYCDFNMKLKVIFMLKTLMYLMSATANESYISDISVGIIVYKDKLDKDDPYIDLKRLISFMDHFRFILEWYKTYTSDPADISKYKFFDSTCKYFVRIMNLGGKYTELITNLINRDMLNAYNEKERANGKIILRATMADKFKHSTAVISDVKDNIKEMQKTFIRSRSNAIIDAPELPFVFNNIIDEIYKTFIDKSYYDMIKPLVTHFIVESNQILQKLNGSEDKPNKSVVELCANIYNKINKILNGN